MQLRKLGEAGHCDPRWDPMQPMVIRRFAAGDDGKEFLLDSLRDGATTTVADLVVVQRPDRRHLRGSAREESFVGARELLELYSASLNRNAKITSDGDDGVTRYSHKDGVALVVGKQDAVFDEEQVFARAFTDTAPQIKQESIIESSAYGLAQSQNGIDVLATGFGGSGHHGGVKFRPTRHTDVHTAPQCLIPVHGIPGKSQDAGVHGTAIREQAKTPAAVIADRTQIAASKTVQPDERAHGLHELLWGKGDAKPIDGGGGEKAVEVCISPKDGGALVGIVAADAFKHSRAVVKGVGRDVDSSVGPRYDLSIHPHPLRLVEHHCWLLV